MARILIVDDNEDHCFLASQELKRCGYEVECAFSGSEGLQMIRSGKFDLALLDYNMPEVNGARVLQQISEERLDVPTVVVTGEGSERVAADLMKGGAFDYVVKSGDYVTVLPTVIERALERHRLIQKSRALEREQLANARLSAVMQTAVTLNHEINSPLFAIQANALLRKKRLGKADARTRRCMEAILESCERISRVMQKLSRVVEPTMKEYAAGVSMLDLGKQAAGTKKNGHDDEVAA